MLKFHLLYHVINDLKQFRCLEILDPLPFERFHMPIKRAYRSTSHWQSSSVVETVGFMGTGRDKRLRRNEIIRNVELSSEAWKVFKFHIKETKCYLIPNAESTALIFCKRSRRSSLRWWSRCHRISIIDSISKLFHGCLICICKEALVVDEGLLQTYTLRFVCRNQAMG